jgi:hypothetical protein
MAGTIRPDLQSPQRPDLPRNAGQRAFFEAAMGRTAQAEVPTSPVASAQSAPTHRVPTSLPAEPQSRILRPGSLLDIRV